MSAGTLDLTITIGATWPGAELTCKDANGVVVPLAGWSAFAEVRKSPNGDVILDLSPAIDADDSAGLITIPAIAWSVTDDLPSGGFRWDLILQDDHGVRYEPTLEGTVTIKRTTTQP